MSLKKNMLIIVCLIAALTTSGCTTAVSKIKVDTKNIKQIEVATIKWQFNPNMQIKIKKLSRGTGQITAYDKAFAVKGANNLVKQFSNHLYNKLSVEFDKRGTKSKKWGDGVPSTSILTVQGTSSYTELDPKICNQHSLMMDVVLLESGKYVWEGKFKVGAPCGKKDDETVVQNFVETLVNKLEKAKALKKLDG